MEEQIGVIYSKVPFAHFFAHRAMRRSGSTKERALRNVYGAPFFLL
jgi:hypothetical protein